MASSASSSRGRRRRALLAIALVAILALAVAPTFARAEDEDDDSAGSAAASEEQAATRPPPPPPPPPRRAGAKLAFAGEAAAYAGIAPDVPSGATKAAPGKPLLPPSSPASQVAAGAALSIAFQTTLGGKSATPQQAVLRLVSSSSSSSSSAGPSAYVWARRREGGEPGDLVVTVTHAEVERQIGRVPAALAATLLVGDPSAAPQPQGAEWPLGEVVFAEAAEASEQQQAAGGSGGGAGEGQQQQQAGAESAEGGNSNKRQPKLLTAAHQPLHNALLDVRHTFRRPEKRAPAAVSLAFTGLALLPLVLLVPALAAAGANLKGWPAAAGSSSWAVAFLASLAAALLLLVVFWLRLTLASLLWPGLAVSSALWFTGWRALRAHASLRLVEEAAGSKKKD